MKKLIFILLASLIILGCNKYVVKNLYERKYEVEQMAITDIYKQLNNYELDSIPLNQWITNSMHMDTLDVEQKMIKRVVNKSTYQFVYTKYIWPVKCICPERVHHQFLIRFFGNKKDLVQ